MSRMAMRRFATQVVKRLAAMAQARATLGAAAEEAQALLSTWKHMSTNKLSGRPCERTLVVTSPFFY
jgi:hypothetical protein